MAQIIPTGEVVGTGMAGPGLLAMQNILKDAKDIKIRQHVSFLEGATGGCCEKSNHYTVYSTHEKEAPVLLEVHEKSNCCDRVYCKPHNSLTLHVRDTGGTVLMTIDRPGKKCFCCGPKPGLGCFAFTDCCLDGVNIYDGMVEGNPGELQAETISKIQQQGGGGGGCTPTLVVDGKPDGTASGYVEGPTCFGGWSECCVDSTFTYSSQRGKSGDIATIKHLKPKDCGGACRELCTDSDNYGVAFGAGASAEQKADAIAASLLADYMFFEIDEGLCHVKEGVLYCTCCLCYCYGCLCPINVCIPLKKQGGGAPASPETMTGAPFAPDSAIPVDGSVEMTRG